MNLLHSLQQLLHGHQQPAAQHIQLPQATPNQQITTPAQERDTYSQNDPSAMFRPGQHLQVGAPNRLASLRVLPQHASGNLGVPYGPLGQGGAYNPGFTPMQGSFGQGAYPQIGAYGGVQLPGDQFNPQDNPNQQYWLQ